MGLILVKTVLHAASSVQEDGVAAPTRMLNAAPITCIVVHPIRTVRLKECS